MSISISGVNHIQNPLLNGGLNEPDWGRIPHAGMKTPLQNELVQQIKDTGSKFAQAKSETEKSVILSSLDKLEAQYLSPVSPDRKALYNDAVKVINQHKSAAKQKQPKPILNFIEYLAEYDGVKTNKTRQYDLTNQPEPLAFGGTVSASCRGYLGFDYMINSGGQQVMSMSGNEWSYTRTPAECKKVEEFTKIFENARDNEMMKQKSSGSSLQNGVNPAASGQDRFNLKV